MKKIILNILVVLIIILVAIGIACIINNSNKTDNIEGKCYIYMFKDFIPGGDYTLEIDEEGNFNLTVQWFSSAVGGKTETSNYNSKLTAQEYEKVKKILSYLNDKYNFDTKDNYIFYFDYDVDAENLSLEDIHILESIGTSIKYIADNNAEGNELLDNIIDELENNN